MVSLPCGHQQKYSCLGGGLLHALASGAFAEWFTIDPPYSPSFMMYKPGQYVNGAVSPFTAGELAKGAFAN